MTLTDLYMNKTAGVMSALLGESGAQSARLGGKAIAGASGVANKAKAFGTAAKNTFKNMGAARQVGAVGVPALGAGYLLGKKNS